MVAANGERDVFTDTSAVQWLTTRPLFMDPGRPTPNERVAAGSHVIQRRTALLTLYPRVQESIDDLDRQVSEMSNQRPQSQWLG
jgi:hypothetical protein